MNDVPTGLDGPRRCRTDEIPGLIALLDRTFRPQGESTMAREFPLFLSVANANNLWVTADGGRIVAHVGVSHKRLNINSSIIHVGLIGAVATDAAYRGRGLATQVLAAARADARERGVGLLLISGARGLYQRCGARPAGNLQRFRIPQTVWERWQSPVRWRLCQVSDTLAMMAWYVMQTPRFMRPLEALRRTCDAGTCGVSVQIAGMHREPIGYVAVKVFDDLIKISEIGGSEEMLEAFPQLAPNGFSGALELLLPAGHPWCPMMLDLAERFERATQGRVGARAPVAPAPPPLYTPHAPFDGTLLWVDFERCVEELRAYWESHDLPRMRGYEADGVCVLSDGYQKVALPPTEMLEFFWGGPPRAPVPNEWTNAIPVPLCPYGLDFI